MSQWTHVAGAIRFDAIRLDGLPEKTPNLGSMCSYDDPPEVWDKCTVPKGSEGSLQWKLEADPDESNMAAYVVTIWGDLRDYDSSDKIIEWIQNHTAKQQMVRQGVIEIRVEGKPIEVWVCANYDGRKWTLVGHGPFPS